MTPVEPLGAVRTVCSSCGNPGATEPIRINNRGERVCKGCADELADAITRYYPIRSPLFHVIYRGPNRRMLFEPAGESVGGAA